MRKRIENAVMDEERALYGMADTDVAHCRFEGPADGESALKECDRVTVEDSFDSEIARKLKRMGHNIRIDLNTPSFGRGQMIIRLENGTLVGGTESRTDSNIACY